MLSFLRSLKYMLAYISDVREMIALCNLPFFFGGKLSTSMPKRNAEDSEGSGEKRQRGATPERSAEADRSGKRGRGGQRLRGGGGRRGGGGGGAMAAQRKIWAPNVRSAGRDVGVLTDVRAPPGVPPEVEHCRSLTAREGVGWGAGGQHARACDGAARQTCPVCELVRRGLS